MATGAAIMERLRQRGEDGYPIGSDVVSRAAWGKIPAATEFWDGYGYSTPDEVLGWSYSQTFGCWRALVNYAGGAYGWASPKTW
jgi:hypothetical protein